MAHHSVLQVLHDGDLPLQQERSGNYGTRSPVHGISPEVWVIIFGFVLGRESFRRHERKAYVCLRSVCTLWRRIAATPGLCTGLDILLDDWVGDLEAPLKRDVKEKLAP
ncbi:hypothetical protein BKA70DRAFT_1445235 [Coprinopsis sp. MPI-PUGE-AT-0042]|nr:hypothetical protein BKA70DRAFT_1445235 [Coprinopsis sp. MPI-PUGE-AT-0042]